MCLIIYSPSGHIPRKHLQRGLKANANGWGFMVAHRGQLHIERGMESRSFWAAWRNKPSGSVVFHSRIGTHGGIDLDNCHPFRLDAKHGDVAMAHNGMIHALPKHSTMSDTRILVRMLDLLPHGFMEDGGTLNLVAAFIGHSKLVFLTGGGEVTMVNEHLGHWHDNRWYSNHSYQPPVLESLKTFGMGFFAK